jgi:hypothetical protein
MQIPSNVADIRPFGTAGAPNPLEFLACFCIRARVIFFFSVSLAPSSHARFSNTGVLLTPAAALFKGGALLALGVIASLISALLFHWPVVESYIAEARPMVFATTVRPARRPRGPHHQRTLRFSAGHARF